MNKIIVYFGVNELSHYDLIKKCKEHAKGIAGNKALPPCVFYSYEMMPHEYIEWIKKCIFDFKRQERDYIIFTKSDFVARELSSMIMAWYAKMNDKEAYEILCKKYSLSKKYYALNPKCIKSYYIEHYNDSPCKIIQYNINQFAEIFDKSINIQNELRDNFLKAMIGEQ